jgi:hypothetical protein
MTPADRTQALRQRLGPYWKIEISAALLLPLSVLRIAPPRTIAEGIALALSLLAVALLLLVGGAYWLAVLKRAQGNGALFTTVMRLADVAERPAIALIVSACIASGIALAAHGWSRPVIAAFSCSGLAVLEYVNYYRVQLQHFDRVADFKRLLSGRGFRKAHLRRDLAAFREASRR